MKVTTYLTFDGKCEEAFKLYEKVLRGKILFMMKQGDSPMADKVPAEMKDKVMHATLETPGGLIQGADHPQGRVVKPAGFSVSVTVKDAAEAERIFKGLSEGGEIKMPLQKTFWSPAFGMFLDRYEVPWMVNTEGEMAS